MVEKNKPWYKEGWAITIYVIIGVIIIISIISTSKECPNQEYSQNIEDGAILSENTSANSNIQNEDIPLNIIYDNCPDDCKDIELLSDGQKILLSINSIQIKESIFSMTFSSSSWGKNIEHTPDDGNKFIEIGLTIKNPNPNEITFDNSYNFGMYAKDKEGKSYPVSQANFHVGDVYLSSGEFETGSVVIEVPNDISTKEIILYRDSVEPRLKIKVN